MGSQRNVSRLRRSPTEHGATVEPSGQKASEWHVSHADFPSASWYSPTLHGSQSKRPGVLVYVPALQGSGADELPGQ